MTVSLYPTAPSRGRLQLGKTRQQNHQLGINPLPRMPLLFPQLQTSAQQDKGCILAGLAVFLLKHPEVKGKHLHGTASPPVYLSRRRSAEMPLGLFSQVARVRIRGNDLKWGLDWILQKNSSLKGLPGIGTAAPVRDRNISSGNLFFLKV